MNKTFTVRNTEYVVTVADEAAAWLDNERWALQTYTMLLKDMAWSSFPVTLRQWNTERGRYVVYIGLPDKEGA